MPDFGSFRGFGEKLAQGQTPTQLGLIGKQEYGIDPDFTAFNARVIAAGGTLSATEQSAVQTLAIALKDANIWDSLKAIYPMVGASAAACAQNLKSASFTGTFNGSLTYASTGVTPDGTSGFLDTNLQMNTNLSVNSNHLSYYSRTSAAAAKYDFGAIQGSNPAHYGLFRDALNILFLVNGNETPTQWISTANLDGSGFFISNRQSSTLFQGIRNSTILSSNTNTNTGGMPSINMYLMRVNGTNLYGIRECAFASIGDGLTNTQSADFYTAVQEFQTTLGRQV
jgi:hypothetical protein